MAQYEKAPSTSVPSQQTALLASSPLGLGWLSGPRGLGGERTAVTHTEPGPGLPRCTSCSAHSQRWSPGNEATRPLPVHRRPWHGPATGVQGGRPHGPGSGVDARSARSGVWGGSVLCPHHPERAPLRCPAVPRATRPPGLQTESGWSCRRSSGARRMGTLARSLLCPLAGVPGGRKGRAVQGREGVPGSGRYWP